MLQSVDTREYFLRQISFYIIFFNFLPECPNVFPDLIIPQNLTVADGQQITCVSPESRPALALEILVGEKVVDTNTNTYTDFSNYIITTASTQVPDITWDGEKIKCCFYSGNCGKLCRPAVEVVVQSRFL